MGLFLQHLPPGTPRGLCALMSLASRSLRGGAELPQPLLVSPVPPCSDVLALLCRTRNVHFPFIQARLHPFLQSEITLFPPFKYTPSPLCFLTPLVSRTQDLRYLALPRSRAMVCGAAPSLFFILRTPNYSSLLFFCCLNASHSAVCSTSTYCFSQAYDLAGSLGACPRSVRSQGRWSAGADPLLVTLFFLTHTQQEPAGAKWVQNVILA